MANVKAAMEYAQTFEREAMKKRLSETGSSDLKAPTLIDVVAKHEQEIQELKRLVTPMMEFGRREWVDLTDDEKCYSNTNYAGKCAEAWQGGVAWAESKLKEKNGG